MSAECALAHTHTYRSVQQFNLANVHLVLAFDEPFGWALLLFWFKLLSVALDTNAQVHAYSRCTSFNFMFGRPSVESVFHAFLLTIRNRPVIITLMLFCTLNGCSHDLRWRSSSSSYSSSLLVFHLKMCLWWKFHARHEIGCIIEIVWNLGNHIHDNCASNLC